MPDKNLCVLSDGTFSFFFFLSSFWEGGFIRHTQRLEIVPKPYVGLLEDFVGSLAQDQEKSTCPLTCVDDQEFSVGVMFVVSLSPFGILWLGMFRVCVDRVALRRIS
jgi:hypothetical protein